MSSIIFDSSGRPASVCLRQLFKFQSSPTDIPARAAGRTLEGHSSCVRAVAFSPDGKLVASASDDNRVRFQDSATGKACKTLKGHSCMVMAVALSPDGKLVASASYDKTVRLWDSVTGAAGEYPLASS